MPRKNRESEQVPSFEVPEQIHATPERIAKALEYDRGDPFNYYIDNRRSARLVTPWDRYCHPDKNGTATLEPHQIAAGNQYAKDYTRAGYGIVKAQGYEPSVDNSGHDEPTWVWDSRNRVRMAQQALRPHEIGLLAFVLFEGRAAKEWAKATGRHARAGIEYLRDALETLAPVYNLAPRRRR